MTDWPTEGEANAGCSHVTVEVIDGAIWATCEPNLEATEEHPDWRTVLAMPHEVDFARERSDGFRAMVEAKTCAGIHYCPMCGDPLPSWHEVETVVEVDA